MTGRVLSVGRDDWRRGPLCVSVVTDSLTSDSVSTVPSQVGALWGSLLGVTKRRDRRGDREDRGKRTDKTTKYLAKERPKSIRQRGRRLTRGAVPGTRVVELQSKTTHPTYTELYSWVEVVESPSSPTPKS